MSTHGTDGDDYDKRNSLYVDSLRLLCGVYKYTLNNMTIKKQTLVTAFYENRSKSVQSGIKVYNPWYLSITQIRQCVYFPGTGTFLNAIVFSL